MRWEGRGRCGGSGGHRPELAEPGSEAEPPTGGGALESARTQKELGRGGSWMGVD